MVDYSEWLHRADVFARSVGVLPGRVGMEVDFLPPLDVADASHLNATLPHGLPAALRDFYVSASAGGRCTFRWTPNESDLELIAKLVPHNYTIQGGPWIFWAINLEGEHQGFVDWAEVLDELGGYGPAAAKTLRECVPLSKIGNGDYLALHAKAGSDRVPVIYIDHEADLELQSPIIPLSESLEQFFTTWERIGYIGPEIWLLNPFLRDSKTGLLDANCPLAIRWRTLLRSFGLPIGND